MNLLPSFSVVNIRLLHWKINNAKKIRAKNSPIVARLEVRRTDRLRDVTGRTEVDDLDTEREADGVDQHDVLGLQVGVNQTKILQLEQRRQNLKCIEILDSRCDVLTVFIYYSM